MREIIDVAIQHVAEVGMVAVEHIIEDTSHTDRDSL